MTMRPFVQIRWPLAILLQLAYIAEMKSCLCTNAALIRQQTEHRRRRRRPVKTDVGRRSQDVAPNSAYELRAEVPRTRRFRLFAGLLEGHDLRNGQRSHPRVCARLPQGPDEQYRKYIDVLFSAEKMSQQGKSTYVDLRIHHFFCFTTLVIHNSLTLSLSAKNLPVSQILPL